MPNESFEILWAKRVSARLKFSYNYWFLQGFAFCIDVKRHVSVCSRCVDPLVKILETSRDRMIFIVDDVTINRVEFLLRRCQNVNISRQGFFLLHSRRRCFFRRPVERTTLVKTNNF